MKLERKNITYPMWRKKVDATLFYESATPIPKWLWNIWNINTLFGKCTSTKDNKSNVKIIFNGIEYSGNIVKHIKRDSYKLKYDKILSDIFKDVFLMSYMRTIENELRAGNVKYKDIDIEEDIPFWEFLDIEFNAAEKTFNFHAHYIQKPQYFELFKELVNSHVVFFA